MNTSKITYTLVSLVVMILLVATILIPVVETAQSTILVTQKNGNELYSLIDSDEEIMLTKDSGQWLINGQSLGEIISEEATEAYLFWDNGVIQIGKNDSGWVSCVIYCMDTDDTIVANQYAAQVAIEDGLVTVTTTASTTITSEYTYMLHPSKTGDYVSYSTTSLSTKDVMANKDSVIYVCSSYWAQSFFIAHGTYSSMTVDYAVSNFEPVDATITIAYTPNESEVSSKLTGVTVTGMPSLRYVQIVVPVEYYLVNNADALYTLLSILPLLLLVVPIAYVVRIFASRSD